MAERHQDAAALGLALAAVALQPLDVAQRAVEVSPHLLHLIVERPALRRLSAEEREEAAALAPEALGLLAEAVELSLLLRHGLFVALDLFRSGGVDARAAIDRRELAFEPQTGLVAPRHPGGGGRIRSRRGDGAGRCRGGEWKAELRQGWRSAKNEGRQSAP
ncbi:MAG: hypothetical protein E6G86_02605 [Alphaproteobacteria bacterium]|nr:MAG: hypothetical protein E6G86_02605 [Alphaproteobacteria bacterium]